jgi:hypothetical protein
MNNQTLDNQEALDQCRLMRQEMTREEHLIVTFGSSNLMQIFNPLSALKPDEVMELPLKGLEWTFHVYELQ